MCYYVPTKLLPADPPLLPNESSFSLLQQYKKRPGMFAGGWKIRHCVLQGVNLTWLENDGRILGSLDVRGSIIDGTCLRQGGSDLEAPPELCTFTVTPSTGRGMELRAENLSDARRWIMVLKSASKGIRHRLRVPRRTSYLSSSAHGLNTLLHPLLRTGSSFQEEQAAAAEGAGGQGGEEAAATAVKPSAADSGQQPSMLGRWEAVVDGQGQTYYWNESTGETLWDPPPGTSTETSTAAATATTAATTTTDAQEDGATPSSPPLPPGWERSADQEGRPYFWRGSTGMTCWDLPSAGENGDRPTESASTNSSLLLGWEAVVDEKGQTYYWNESTGETLWEAPLQSTATTSTSVAAAHGLYR
jgi:hypothetical protein